MEYIVGITLALLFCAAAAGLGMDRERVFYPAVLIAVASYYVSFAVVDGHASGSQEFGEEHDPAVRRGLPPCRPSERAFARPSWWATIASSLACASTDFFSSSDSPIG